MIKGSEYAGGMMCRRADEQAGPPCGSLETQCFLLWESFSVALNLLTDYMNSIHIKEGNRLS